MMSAEEGTVSQLHFASKVAGVEMQVINVRLIKDRL